MTLLICLAGYVACVFLAAYILGWIDGSGGMAILGPVTLIVLALAGLAALVILTFEAGEKRGQQERRTRVAPPAAPGEEPTDG